MKINKSLLFKVANLLKKRYNLSLSEALTLSWQNTKLKLYFHEKAIHFSYLKKDGTIREAFGTLRNIEYQLKGNDKFKFDILTSRYFDLEKQEFRAFKIKNLISIDNF